MTVDYARDDDVAWIHLNRPHRLNAVVPALVDGLLDALERAAREGSRVVVLAGRGRSFCAGHDLKEPVPNETREQTAARVDRIQDVTRLMRDFPGIAIAAVHGHALGAGCEFALGCDLVLADETARFGFPEVGVGLSVTGGVSQLLPRAVGVARAKELLLLGEHLSAEAARTLGLVNAVVPPGQHESAAAELAARICGQPPLATTLAKQALDRGQDADLEAALALERQHAVQTSQSGEAAAPREAFSGE